MTVKDDGTYIVIFKLGRKNNEREPNSRHSFIYNSHNVNEHKPTVHKAIIDNRPEYSLLGIEDTD